MGDGAWVLARQHPRLVPRKRFPIPAYVARGHPVLEEENANLLLSSLGFPFFNRDEMCCRNVVEMCCRTMMPSILNFPRTLIPYVASVGKVFVSHAANAWTIAARDTFCPHGRMYFNVFRTIPIQFCPHGSVHYTVNDNPY